MDVYYVVAWATEEKESLEAGRRKILGVQLQLGFLISRRIGVHASPELGCCVQHT